MKKNRLSFLALFLIVIFAITSCESTPETEEDVIETVEVENEEDVQIEEDVISDDLVENTLIDYTEENKKLFEDLNMARKRAVAAGAELYLQKELSVVDARFLQEKEMLQEESVEYNTLLKEFTLLYKAIEEGSLAAESYERIVGFEFEEVSPIDFEKAKVASKKAKDLFIEKAPALEVLRELSFAKESFLKVIAVAFNNLAREERVKILKVKTSADQIKANVAAKEAYDEALLLFTNADAHLNEGKAEESYKDFSASYEKFTRLYEDVLKRRTLAQEAIERARLRTEEASVKASEADELAPISEVLTEDSSEKDGE